MPAPTPLTACEPPHLDWSRPGTPAATDFGDIYFSVDGGLEETEAVYLKGCGLPEAWHNEVWQNQSRFVIGELGFGSGLNFLAAWRMWEATKPKAGHLHFVSVEKYPFSMKELETALAAWPELKKKAARLIALWPGRVKGAHTLHVAPDVSLTLLHGDVLTALGRLRGLVNAWFLDGFSPAKNPDMWSQDVMNELARLSATGARVGTFTAAGAVRTALSRAGFTVEKKEGFGRKRHRLEAIYPGEINSKRAAIKPVIIGGGIAGASLARACLRRGITPILIDPDDDTAASGNPAAIVKPRLDLQDRPESRFFLESYLYALRAYEESGAVLLRGVFHAAKTETEQVRFEKLANHAALPLAHMKLQSGPYGLHGLNFPQALILDPLATCAAFIEGAPKTRARAYQVSMETGRYIVRDKEGVELAAGTHVFAVMGAGIKSFDGASELSLRYSRGQITAASTRISETLTYGGYAIPLPEQTLLGATHARLTDDNPYMVTDADDAENIEKFKEITGEKTEIMSGGSRASVRVTRANTLPLIHTHNNMYTVTGLGSRGFVFAPLLAERIVAQICGEPHMALPSSFLTP